ncbi:MAG: FCD domain-containing protein [Anaerolineaceae bacterium]|nr:FCD domain-containing protein [Anaerolineaceae bacterium]
MLRERIPSETLSEFLRYLASVEQNNGGRIPSLAELSGQLGISIASLREQLEVARALGFVEVRPKTGMRCLPYSFRPAVRQSLAYAVAIDSSQFQTYSDLRNHIETAYFLEAVALLTPEDHKYLMELVDRAKQKLHGNPVQIPHQEHRELHLTIYGHLNNPFVSGLLEAYWELYEAVGLSVYSDINYLEQVWQYHQKMVEEIRVGNYTNGYQVLVDHMNLLNQRSKSLSRQKFE